jgi:hypothetical protein
LQRKREKTDEKAVFQAGGIASNILQRRNVRRLGRIIARTAAEKKHAVKKAMQQA